MTIIPASIISAIICLIFANHYGRPFKGAEIDPVLWLLSYSICAGLIFALYFLFQAFKFHWENLGDKV